jgi:hypothetical protein
VISSHKNELSTDPKVLNIIAANIIIQHFFGEIIMKCFIFMIAIVFTNVANAECDLTIFRWGCDMTIQPHPTHWARSLVYCGNAYGYGTPAQYNMLQHYQRANVDFVLKLNGEFIEGPCVPGYR